MNYEFSSLCDVGRVVSFVPYSSIFMLRIIDETLAQGGNGGKKTAVFPALIEIFYRPASMYAPLLAVVWLERLGKLGK